jgi:exoribonuclease-2
MSSKAPFDLLAAARELMKQYGFEPDYPAQVKQEVAALQANPPQPLASAVDLRHLLWSSIDNDTSRDLDQVEYAERLPDGSLRVLVGVADVDMYVTKGSAIDKHASIETVTVYSGVKNFSMLPDELTNDLTSLVEGCDRACMITEFTLDKDICADESCVTSSKIYPALINNKAQLAYNGVGAWLDGNGEAPPKIAGSSELQEQLRLQSEVARRLRHERFLHGALDIETLETHAILHDKKIDLDQQRKNSATELIEDFMIAANGIVARTLRERKISSIRRIVRTPKRWDRIVALADGLGFKLPEQPDPKALNDFLLQRKKDDPDHFTDLSLTVVKLMGPGEYVLERASDPPQGHFGLAVEDYTHSTAPNRRYADVVTQRLLKAMIAGEPSPYSDEELSAIALNCTEKSAAERKVERGMNKRIAAVALSHRIGERFHAIVTGAGPSGTFVRTLTPHVEGMLVHGQQGADVGDRMNVRLVHTDPSRGYIDFARA